MNHPRLTTPFADAVESELAALGTRTTRLERGQRRARTIAALIATAAVGAALSGAAIVATTLPGEITTRPIGETVTGSFTGTAAVDLGTVPSDAAAVILEITCTKGGAMGVLLDGRSAERLTWDCGDSLGNETIRITDGRLPAPGETSITVTADPGTQWDITAQYAAVDTTEWGVNENGQTYGVPTGELPDLQSAMATNGALGYILTDELLSFEGEGTIPVYESDGTTVIGRFSIGSD